MMKVVPYVIGRRDALIKCRRKVKMLHIGHVVGFMPKIGHKCVMTIKWV